MISTGYNQIKWGILISIIHIYISTELGGFEIVPAFIGYFLIMRGTSAICSETNLEQLKSRKPAAVYFVLCLLDYRYFSRIRACHPEADSDCLLFI
mgnify:CR=1 FL=1